MPADKASLAARMKPRKPADKDQESAAGKSVSEHFKNGDEQYTKRLTLDLTKEQHKKLQLLSVRTGKKMAPILREFIDSLPE